MWPLRGARALGLGCLIWGSELRLGVSGLELRVWGKGVDHAAAVAVPLGNLFLPKQRPGSTPSSNRPLLLDRFLQGLMYPAAVWFEAPNKLKLRA